MEKKVIVQMIKDLNAPSMPIKSLDWQKAFEIYNQDYGLIDKSLILSMGCRPCYAKVAAYIVDKYLTQI